MSVISAGTTLTTALVQTGDTNGNLVFKTGSGGTTALTLGSDQSATFAGAVSFSGGISGNINFDSGTLFIDGANNRVGVGTSSPAKTLDVNGQSDFRAKISAQSTTQDIFQVTNNTGFGAAVTFADQGWASRIATNNGNLIFYNASETTERMRIDSSGNVGIGTSSPTSKLYVEGTVQARSGGTGIALYGDGAAGYISSVGSTPLILQTNFTERTRLDSSGNLGLGVTPFANTISVGLDLANGSGIFGYANGTYLNTNAYYNGAWRYKASAHATQYVSGGGTHQWHIAPSGTAGNAITFTQAMTLDASGNLGIGVTSPSYPLDILSNSSAWSANFRGRSGDNLTYIRFASHNNATTYAAIGTPAVNTLGFDVNGTERMRIDSSGNLLVGTTNGDPIGAGVRGTVIRTDSQLNCMANANRAGAFGRYSSTGPLIQFFYFGGSLLEVGSISTNGSNTSYNTSSDYRLKENIAPMTGALDKVQALKPCTYTWKSTGEASQGFIAHELQEVVPDCVTGEKDAVDADGKPVYQGIDTSFLVATLTAAIQEQQAIINDLTTRLTALENK